MKRLPLYQCQECGKPFYSAIAARNAAFGDHGCPKCGGSDIDVYLPSSRACFGVAAKAGFTIKGAIGEGRAA